eukprot:scaffold131685_cov18-Tisochrysis_lutea.AAC.2
MLASLQRPSYCRTLAHTRCSHIKVSALFDAGIIRDLQALASQLATPARRPYSRAKMHQNVIITSSMSFAWAQAKAMT